MTRAIIARQSGDDLQAMLFIIECCRLLHDHEHVNEVGFEVNDAKGFDDIKVSYSKSIPDGCGDFFDTEYIQVKFHALPGKHVTANDLIDPEFIGAISESLLQKAHRLQQKHAPKGIGCRIILRQPSPIAEGDPLSKLLDQQAGFLRLDSLFYGGPRSEMGKLRKSWCNHLHVDIKSLELALRPLRIQIFSETLEQIRRKLNDTVQVAGLKPVDLTQRSNPYIQIPWDLVAETGEVTLDRKRLTDLMKHQGLYRGPPLNQKAIRKLGLKSFSKSSNHLDSLVDKSHSFVDLFNNGQIKDQDHWNSRIYPEVISFLESEIVPGDITHLHLDCHYSIAYTAGYASARCKAKVGPNQFGDPWFISDRPYRPFEELWKMTPHQLQKGEDIAVVVSVSQNICEDVMRTIKELDLPIGLLIEATVLPKVGSFSVQGADHGFLLAHELMQYVQNVSAKNARRGCIHLFVSVPSAMMFFMGKEGYTLPKVQLYEYYNSRYCHSILIG
jgi:hypothetical protein